MDWNSLEDLKQLELIDEASAFTPVLIFKHSTRCSISSTALNRLERNWKPEDSRKIHPYYLDLLNYRSISNAVAERYGVEHESPQVIVIENGRAIFHASHTAIDYRLLPILQ